VGHDTHTLKVSGMHCAGCVGKVEAAVAELPGVVRVAVSLEPGLARVDFDGARVSPEAIVQAIAGLGYRAEARDHAEAALDREQALRQAELDRQSRWMFVAWPSPCSSWRDLPRVLDLPALVPAWLGQPFALFLLATPAVFGPGWQFFTQSARPASVYRHEPPLRDRHRGRVLIGVSNTFFPTRASAASGRSSSSRRCSRPSSSSASTER
jgi:copper ion binding protein